MILHAKPSSAKLAYKRGFAEQFVDGLRQRGRVCFALDELLNASDLSLIAARRQLARLGARVVRVTPRQEFFLIVDPEHRPNGAPPPGWWLNAYFRWLERPYYLALQSATAEYGSAAQAIQVTQVMTDRPRRDIELGRIRVQFFVKGAVAATPTQPLANAFAPLTVSTLEATVVDLVGYAPRIGGIGRVAETLQPLLPRLKAAGLTQALAHGAETPTLQRLGFLLETLGYPRLAKSVHERLPRAVKPVPLDLGAGPLTNRQSVTNQRWSIVVNATVKASA